MKGKAGQTRQTWPGVLKLEDHLGSHPRRAATPPDMESGFSNALDSLGPLPYLLSVPPSTHSSSPYHICLPEPVVGS